MADENENEDTSPLGTLGLGLLLVAIGVGCYFWFDHLETQGGRIRTHVLIILLYNFLGKWGVLGVVGGIGALMTVFGIKGLIAGKPAAAEE